MEATETDEKVIESLGSMPHLSPGCIRTGVRRCLGCVVAEPHVVPAHLSTGTGALRGPSASLPLPTSPPRALPASVRRARPPLPGAAQRRAACSHSARPVHDSPAPTQPPHTRQPPAALKPVHNVGATIAALSPRSERPCSRCQLCGQRRSPRPRTHVRSANSSMV